jgi:hypothetical protein
MRKDIFIVGARLLGLWQLIGALSPLSYLVGTEFGFVHPQITTQEYNAVALVVHLLTGLYLLFRPHQLFGVLDRLEPSVGPSESSGDAPGAGQPPA